MDEQAGWLTVIWLLGVVLKLFSVLSILVAVAAIWIRLAPSDPARWHKALSDPVDQESLGSVVRILSGRAIQMPELEEIIQRTPRTKLLAGSAAEKKFTYVTRSLIWGFPDYATVWVNGDDLIIYSRLRYGRGDSGVNKTRVDGWIELLPSP